MSDSILLSINEGVATITLNRPQSLNSFNTEMHLQLRDAIATVAADASVRCVLLTGAGRGFCAGQDLGDRNFDDGQRAPDLGATLNTYYNPLIKSIRDLPLLGDKLSATQAEKMGLIWEVKADDELMPHCQQLAQHLATQPTYGLGLIKQSLNASLNNDLDSQLALESEIQRKAGQSQDYQIGVQAFMNKQKPVYTGR
jgi:enoyl-CoA hydratase/carnithine racemase